SDCPAPASARRHTQSPSPRPAPPPRYTHSSSFHPSLSCSRFFLLFSSSRQPTNDLGGAPSFAFCAKGGPLRSNTTHSLLRSSSALLCVLCASALSFSF